MLYLLANWSEHFGPLRLFDYVTFRAAGAFLTAFLAGRSFQDNPGGATSEMITLTGAASEILLCLTGILLVK